jgi:4-amino-4-deoxy-L-arabinose transferase-like glycosyltransferase
LHPSTLAKRGIVLLLPVIVIFYLYGLGQFPFVGPDEPRYAQVAREMLLRHDLVTPTLGGYPWFEKPALLYWLMIASCKIFGVSEWAARLPSAVSGLLTIAAVYCISRRGLREEAGGAFAFWSTLAAATMLGVVVFSRAASFDIILTMATTWSLAFYLLYEIESRAKLRQACLVGFYAFIGVSLLGKGLVGIVIPIGVVMVYQLFCRQLPDRKTVLSLFWGIPLALLVAASWYGPVIARNGWPFIDQFFIQHHFARYVSNKYHHSQRLYFYLGIIPLLALPWTAFLGDGCWRALRNVTGGPTATAGKRDQLDDKLMPFALAWLLFPLAFFSLANSKLPGYILPVLPACALLVAASLSRHSEATVSSWTSKITAALFLIGSVGAPAYALGGGELALGYAVALAVPLGLAGVLGFVMWRRPEVTIMLFASATLIAAVVALQWVAPRAAEQETTKHLLQLADARGYSHALVYGLQRDDRTPEFYAAGRVAYGADGEAIMYQEPFLAIRESKNRNLAVLVFVPVSKVDEITGSPGAQTEVIGNNGRNALVAVKAY